MILIEATIKYKGYNPNSLKPKSHKRVCCSCNKCGKVRYIPYQSYHPLCNLCAKLGENHPNYKGGLVTKICKWCNKEYKLKPSIKNPKFCSKKCQGKWNSENLVGNKHPSYNSNITDKERLIRRQYPKYNEWRNLVFKRDNYTCQKCNQIGYKLNAHHIKGYANNKELRTNLDNGITLCKDCHKSFHCIYGNNCNKEQFIEFMDNY